MNWIMDQLKKMFLAKMGDLPPEARLALEKTQVTITRRTDRIEIIIDGEGDADAEKVKDLLLDGMLGPLSQMVGFFGCQVEVTPQID
jgi:hypothetical protein